MHPREPGPMHPELDALIGYAAHALNTHTSHDGLWAECGCAWPFLTDEAFAAGRRDGRYLALCGVDVLPAPLTAAEAHHCSGCVAS
jgi:hypothetical protein